MTTAFFIFAFLVVSVQTYHNYKYFRLNLKWNDPKELEKRLVVVRRQTVEFLEAQKEELLSDFTERTTHIYTEIAKLSISK